MTDWTRRGAAAAALGLALPGLAHAQTPAPPGFGAARLQRGRLTVPVHINGKGPLAFAVDSAANASVIAADLVERFELPDAGEVTMHTMIARETAATVRAHLLETGALTAHDTRLALASRIGLDGADGLIGTDLLAGLRLDLRFQGVQRARIVGSRPTGGQFFEARHQSARLIRAVEQRFGELLMISIRAGGVESLAIIDTGAQATIINTALARASGALPLILRDGSHEARVQSPTGRSAPAQAMMINNLRFGGLGLGRLPVLAGDFHTFDLWGVADRPAMLMGVDVLGLFDNVAIDLRRGEVVFEL